MTAAPPTIVPAPVRGEVFEPMPALVRRHAVARAGHPAIRDGGRTVAWGELGRRVDRVAAALAAAGLRTGGRVACLSENSADFVALYLGTLAAGGCMVPLPTSATPRTLGGMLADSGGRFLFASARYRPAAEEIAGGVPVRVGLDFADGAWMGLEDWLGAAADPQDVEPGPDDAFDIIYSSGTTSVPKGILHDHRFRSRQNRQRVAAYGLGGDAVTLVATPLYSNTTLVALLPTLAGGGTVVLMRKFDARGYLEVAECERATHTMLVPVQYERILALPDFDRFDLSSFRAKMSTSAPLRAPVLRAILERWPGRMLDGYGMTEGGVSTVLDASAFPGKLDSVGRPAGGADIRIIDERGRELPRGGTGEIVGRSSTMMSGYHGAPAATREAVWFSPEGEAFIRSGDLGRFDEDGFLYLLDRRKDMILSGGFNIYASDLEQVLLSHDAVAEAAVVAAPSPDWGETPLGFVVLKPGRTVDAADLLAWANGRLGRTHRLSGLELRESLPRSEIGKVLKRELRAPYWQGERGA
ncbi:AMP-binding protein (plasmid) [Skermanella rosea]|uniref:class I adenylate-forming enzyme family protein n=1 Tax=Skermanella rosea TaxID=1817965 RepID=UPI001932A0FC|nr:AMP-binding protein [Skermanella rosea]UEM07788.1 AMP-binding protein [Skermanella rosea]